MQLALYGVAHIHGRLLLYLRPSYSSSKTPQFLSTFYGHLLLLLMDYWGCGTPLKIDSRMYTWSFLDYDITARKSIPRSCNIVRLMRLYTVLCRENAAHLLLLGLAQVHPNNDMFV